jgi:hypothetical protein
MKIEKFMIGMVVISIIFLLSIAKTINDKKDKEIQIKTKEKTIKN